MARFTKKAIAVLSSTELRAIAVQVMGMKNLEAWQMKPGAMQTWVYKNKDDLKSGDITKLGAFRDKFRPGIVDYVEGIHGFLNSTADDMPTWDGLVGVTTMVEDSMGVEDEAVKAVGVPEVKAHVADPEAPKKRGRPRGSRNKPKGPVGPVKAAEEAKPEEAPKKKTLGKPKLSLKKAPVVETVAEPAGPIDLETVLGPLGFLTNDVSRIQETVDEMFGQQRETHADVEGLSNKLNDIAAVLVLVVNGLFEAEYSTIEDVLA